MERAKAAGRSWDVRGYHLEVVPWRRAGWRWSCSADGVGVGGYRTPWGAWWARWALFRRGPGRGGCL